MSGLTGKGATSIKKQEVKESRIPAVAFDKVRFLHKMAFGASSISLTALTAPSISEAPQYSAPSVSQLTALNLAQYPNNLSLVSSVRGRLMRNIDFDIAGASTITLLYAAEENEIIEGVIDAQAVTGQTIVDAKPIVATGTLSAGSTDFNVGEPFEVGKYPLTQHGAVIVIVDGQVMYRNTNNSAPGSGVDGDYYEVHAGAGLGTIIRFNTPDFVNDRLVSVISVAALTERPNGSMMAFIESVNGKVDSMIPTLASLAEVSESTFGGVSNVDLKAFGDRVLILEKILDMQVPIMTDWVNEGPVGLTAVSGGLVKGTTSVDAVWSRRIGSDLHVRVEYRQTGTGTAGSGEYLFTVPGGRSIDVNKVTADATSGSFTAKDSVGYGQAHASTSLANVNVHVYDATKVRLSGVDNTTYGTVSSGLYSVSLAGAAYVFFYIVPIQGWASTQTVRQALGL